MNSERSKSKWMTRCFPRINQNMDFQNSENLHKKSSTNLFSPKNSRSSTECHSLAKFKMTEWMTQSYHKIWMPWWSRIIQLRKVTSKISTNTNPIKWVNQWSHRSKEESWAKVSLVRKVARQGSQLNDFHNIAFDTDKISLSKIDLKLYTIISLASSK
jgi:hypothetical protein